MCPRRGRRLCSCLVGATAVGQCQLDSTTRIRPQQDKGKPAPTGRNRGRLFQRLPGRCLSLPDLRQGNLQQRPPGTELRVV